MSAPPRRRLYHHPAGQPRFLAEVTAALPLQAPERSDKNWETRSTQFSPSDKSRGHCRRSCRDTERLSIQERLYLVRPCFSCLLRCSRAADPYRLRTRLVSANMTALVLDVFHSESCRYDIIIICWMGLDDETNILHGYLMHSGNRLHLFHLIVPFAFNEK